MQEHFERFRDPVNTIRRSYKGAFNNRIDKFPAVGSSFRVEGVTKHALKTNCFISEDSRTTRELPLPNNIDETGGGDAYCRNGYTYLNRCMYAAPDYPPGFPGFSNRCVEPTFMIDTPSSELSRFALNKTFDNVQWRTEISKNSLDCNVYDTVELVPWLSHSVCLSDVDRKDSVKQDNFIWYDFNRKQELNSTPTIPDCIIPLSHRRRIGISKYYIQGAGPYVFTPFDETRGYEIAQTYLFHKESFVRNHTNLTFDFATKQYSNAEAISISDDVAADYTENNIVDYWDAYHTYTTPNEDGAYTVRSAAINAAVELYIRPGDLKTTKLQPDGYCYYGDPPLAPILHDAGLPIRQWIHLYAWIAAEYRITPFTIAVHSFRIPLGSTRIDFQLPCDKTGSQWHGHFYNNDVKPGALRLNLATGINFGVPTVGDLYDGNIGIHQAHIDHHGNISGGLLKPVKFARLFYDTPEAPNPDNLLGGLWYQATAKHPFGHANVGQPITGNLPTGVVGEEITPWCIEFDLTTDLGRYLYQYWKSQCNVDKALRAANIYWRNGDAAAIPFKCYANTSYQAVGIHADLINNFTYLTINSDNIINPFGFNAFPFQNVNDNQERGRLYFRKIIVANVDTTVSDILWNASFDAASNTQYHTEAAVTSTNLGLTAFAKWKSPLTILNPAAGGAYAINPLARIRLLDQSNAGHKTLFEGYYGENGREINLYTAQPDKTQVHYPIIPIGFQYKLYEPFFVMGSGKSMLPCKRPFDIEGDEFPLVVQDYRVTFRRRFDRGFYKYPLNSNTARIEDYYSWDRFFTTGSVVAGVDIVREKVGDVLIDKQIQHNLKLITHSQDTAIQAEKEISFIEKYVPKLDIYATSFVSPDDATITQRLYIDKGFPSFLFLRIEWNSREMDPSFTSTTPLTRLKIQSVVVKLFGKNNEFVSSLLEEDLYFLCRKNCHKYCDFKNLWDNENALLLSLEDLGLMGELVGFPNRKRLDFEIRVTWKLPETDTYERMMTTAGRTVQLRSVFINENHYLRGGRSQIEFYEVF